MKTNIKRCFALLLAVVMIMAMGVTAVAEETTYKITVNPAYEGQTYKAYKLFDLTYDTDSSGTTSSYKYTYTPTSTQSDAFYLALTSNASPFSLVEETSGTYVVSVKNGKNEENVIDWLKSQTSNFPNTEVATETANGSDPEKENEKTTVTLKVNSPGYYYVTTTTGTGIVLDTASPTVTVEDKNTIPLVVKKVQEDSEDLYEEENTADVGDTINFESEITLEKGAQNITYHDVMSEGLTLDANSIKVSVTTNGATISTSDYEVKTSGLTDNCTFEVLFDSDYLAGIEGQRKIKITYSATLNENAVVSGDGNSNKGKVSFGNDGNSSTEWDETTTYTYEFNIFKYTEKDNAEKALEGVGFKIYNLDGKYAEFTTETDSNGNTYYLLGKTENETTTQWSETGTEIKSDSKGNISIQGLDAGTYYITETSPLGGYTKAGDMKVVIGDDGTVKVANSKDGAASDVTNKTARIINGTGSELPSTGGMGTTIFYIVGSVLVIGAVVLIITRRRMNGAKG